MAHDAWDIANARWKARSPSRGTSFARHWQNSQAIAALGTRLDKLDGRVDKLDGRIDKLDGRVDRLEAMVGSLKTQFDGFPKVIADVMREVLAERQTYRGTALNPAHPVARNSQAGQLPQP